MTSQPQAFLSNSEVMRLVREQQMAALPITAVRAKRAINSGSWKGSPPGAWQETMSL